MYFSPVCFCLSLSLCVSVCHDSMRTHVSHFMWLCLSVCVFFFFSELLPPSSCQCVQLYVVPVTQSFSGSAVSVMYELYFHCAIFASLPMFVFLTVCVAVCLNLCCCECFVCFSFSLCVIVSTFLSLSPSPSVWLCVYLCV